MKMTERIRRECLKFLLWWNGPDTIFYIGGADVLPEPLTAEEEKNCLFALSFQAECSRDGEQDGMSREEARKLLISHNLRLVVYLAKKFENTGIGVEDLISIGSIGLIKGINTFNPDKKIKLATYASRCIENEILMYLRRTNKTKLEVSIDEPLNVDWDGNELLLSDILGTDEDIIYRDMENEAELVHLRAAVEKLSAREREIIEMRYGLNQRNGKEMTQKEVADVLGISQSYISRLEKKIMSRLKKEMLKLQ
jgi:RNA polymerase sporulation-specific sigma factor